MIDDKSSADSLVSVLKYFKPSTPEQEIELNIHLLSYVANLGTIDEIRMAIANYNDYYYFDNRFVLNLAIAYNNIGENVHALNLLNGIKEKGIEYDTLRLEAIKVYVYRDLDDYHNAFDALWNYYHINDSLEIQSYHNKVNSLEDELRIQLKEQDELHKKEQVLLINITIITLLITLVIILSFIIRNIRSKKNIALQKEKIQQFENEKLLLEKEKRELEIQDLGRRLDSLDSENEKLKEILGDKESLPKEVLETVKLRLEILNSILAHAISGDEKFFDQYKESIKSATDNTSDFMHSNRLAFQASHPLFIQYLEEHKLNVDEINYVCLYALGLRGKEIGNYMKMRSHFNISSTIRKKLGLERSDTNLGIYIRKLLKSLQ